MSGIGDARSSVPVWSTLLSRSLRQFVQWPHGIPSSKSDPLAADDETFILIRTPTSEWRLARGARLAKLWPIGTALLAFCAYGGTLRSDLPFLRTFDFTPEHRGVGNFKDTQNVGDLLPGESTVGTAGHGSAPIEKSAVRRRNGVAVADAEGAGIWPDLTLAFVHEINPA